MRSFRELIVVKLNQWCDGIINCGQLYQCHLPVLGEKLKCLKNEKFYIIISILSFQELCISYFSAKSWCVCILFFSSSIKCNIVSLLCCFRKKKVVSWFMLGLSWYTTQISNTKTAHNKQHQFNSIFLSLSFLTFPTQEIVDNVLHYWDWEHCEQWEDYLPHCYRVV